MDEWRLHKRAGNREGRPEEVIEIKRRVKEGEKEDMRHGRQDRWKKER